MSTTVGEAIIKLRFGDKDLDKDLKEKASKIDGFFGKVKKGGAIAAKGFAVAGASIAAAGTAITALGSKAIAAYADFEQLSGGMQKIFDEVNYDQIAKDAQNAYLTMNISANQYMESLAGVGATFAQTMGDQKGYDTAKAGMQALADYASGTGKNVDELMEKYQMITKSTTSYLSIADQFAGLLPQTTDGFLKQAQAAGFLDESYTKLNEVPVAEYQQAITKMLEKGVDEMGLMGNTAAESAGTISGSLNATKSAWENLMVAVASGEGMDQAFDNFITSAGNLSTNLIKILPQVVEGIVGLINALIPQLPTILQQILPPLIQGAIQIMSGIVQALPEIVTMLIDALPLLIDGLVTFLTDPANIEALINASILLFLGLVAAVPQILGALMEAFGKLFGQLWTQLETLFKNFAGDFGKTIGGIFKGAINGVLRFIEGFINGPIDLINGFINTINNAFGVVGVHIGHIGRVNLPRLAQGGLATGATTAVIGEAGREAVLPLDRNTDNWSGLLAGALADEFAEMGGTPTGSPIYVTMQNTINNGLDADEIGQRLITSIRRAA